MVETFVTVDGKPSILRIEADDDGESASGVIFVNLVQARLSYRIFDRYYLNVGYRGGKQRV